MKTEEKRKPLEIQGVMAVISILEITELVGNSDEFNTKKPPDVGRIRGLSVAASVITTVAAPVCEVFMSRRRAIMRDPPSMD